MKPDKQFIIIDHNIEKIKEFINEIIIEPKHLLSKWAKITAHPINQGENSLILYKICTFAP